MIPKSAGSVTSSAVSRLSELLSPHVRREEAGVFRVADDIGLGNEYVDDLEDDHRFEKLLARPETLDAESLESLLDELYRHIAVEEYDLFPMVAKELNARLLDDYAGTVGNQRDPNLARWDQDRLTFVVLQREPLGDVVSLPRSLDDLPVSKDVGQALA